MQLFARQGQRKLRCEEQTMLKESVVSVYCAAAAEQVELTLSFAVSNGYGCAVDCSCTDGSCSREALCRLRSSRECELQKWTQEELL